MTNLLHELLLDARERTPEHPAIVKKDEALTYAEVCDRVERLAAGFVSLGLQRQERVAVYLPKEPDAVVAMFAATLAGGVFVPVNPLLKSEQVGHILHDCNVRVLVTSDDRLGPLADVVKTCTDLRHVVVTGDHSASGNDISDRCVSMNNLLGAATSARFHRVIDQDIASIFYTSGSTGKPKGVVLSHRNMVSGAASVAEYLAAHRDDRVLAVLPFSFDYGFSQLSISFLVGSTVTLMDYLFPNDVIKALARHKISALAGVPPLWVQLAKLEWPDEVAHGLRYITNSGGAMPRKTLSALRARLPKTRVFLMYGLTEAFRSTYLDPAQVEERPDSMGKAIPNAEILVVDADGTPCEPGQPGELVHRGALVSLGYWNDPEKTAERFRPAPGQIEGIVRPEMAVWSGDTVTMDDEGYLYFIGRADDMIKTSGYRVSPTEVEEAIYDSGLAAEAIAVGVPHPEFGQKIVAVAVPANNQPAESEALIANLSQRLPNYMVPAAVAWRESLPRNPNGKIDRKSIQQELSGMFDPTTESP